MTKEQIETDAKRKGLACLFLPAEEAAPYDASLKMPDASMSPLFEKGDILFIQEKQNRAEYNDGDLCIVAINGEPSVRLFQLIEGRAWFWSIGEEDRVDVFEPSALDDVFFFAKIVAVYRRMPYMIPKEESAGAANG